MGRGNVGVSDGGRYSFEDTIMRERVRYIVKDRNIQAIVETGVFQGLSTIVLADMAPVVFAIENEDDYIPGILQNYTNHNVHKKIVLCTGSSPDVLTALRPLLPDNTLYFLDAHWQDYWPLLDEIRSIKKRTGVIVIHDIYVPGHPELGEYVCNGHRLDYDYVRDVLTEWSPTHRIEYNERVDSKSPCGALYCFPE